MLIKLQKVFVSILCLVLLWTGGGAAEASALFFVPNSLASSSYRNFRRNEQEMRLKTQALAAESQMALNPNFRCRDLTKRTTNTS